MKISVVVPTLDEAACIEATLASAAADGVEIIVVDGGSGDGTPELAVAAGARVLQAPPGRARQLGAGARESRGDVIVFLHADTQLPEGWRETVERVLQDSGVAGGAFRFCFDPEALGQTPFWERLALHLIEVGTRVRVALFGLPYGDQALFVRRPVLEAIGGVPQVPIMEDLDLVRALKRAGRLARLAAPAATSPRRHRAEGPLRLALRHALLALGWRLGVARGRLAAWSGR